LLRSLTVNSAGSIDPAAKLYSTGFLECARNDAGRLILIREIRVIRVSFSIGAA